MADKPVVVHDEKNKEHKEKKEKKEKKVKEKDKKHKHKHQKDEQMEMKQSCSPAPALVAASPLLEARAQAVSSRIHVSELAFAEGDLITGIREIDADWLEGDCKGRRGRFPRYRITVLEELLQEAHANKSAAQIELGWRYLFARGGVEMGDRKLCYEHFSKAAAADRDSIHARYWLARCYCGGFGVAEDQGLCVAELKKISARGDLASKAWLAYCYRQGWGTAKDEKEAFKLSEEAANQGSVEAQVHVVECYQYGQGVSKDDKRMFALCKLYAERDGNENLFTKMSLCYERGIGTAVDPEQCAKWCLRDAETTGNPSCMYRVGQFYEKGQGVAKNLEEAIVWYKKSAVKGSLQAKDAVKRLAVE